MDASNLMDASKKCQAAYLNLCLQLHQSRFVPSACYIVRELEWLKKCDKVSGQRDLSELRHTIKEQIGEEGYAATMMYVDTTKHRESVVQAVVTHSHTLRSEMRKSLQWRNRMVFMQKSFPSRLSSLFGFTSLPWSSFNSFAGKHSTGAK